MSSSWRPTILSLVLLGVTAPLRAEVPQLDAGSNLMLRSPDIQFAMRLSQSATGAAALGHTAGSRSKNTEVQALTREIAESSAKVQSGLETVVEPMRVTLPGEIPADELSTLVKLQNLPARRIDHTYLKAEVKQLKRNVKAVKTEIKKGKSPEMRRFAAGVLPVFEAHLEKARSLYRTVPKK